MPLTAPAPEPWTPLTDPEWSALSLYVTHRTGRPPRDPRRTWDAIFWIATSTLPWAALPPEFGRAETHHSALIHAARTGVLDRLLVAVSGHPLAPEGMDTLKHRVCRAVLRASRQLKPETLLLARTLGFREALYCDPALLPNLSESDSAKPPRDYRAPLRLPRIPRRALRGLAPPRGFAITPVPDRPARPSAPRRASQGPRICPKPSARAIRARICPKR